MKKICIIHYNTPFLTECLIRSINKFTPNCTIYVFDNSDKKPFTGIFPNVVVYDNTHGAAIDFEKWLEKYPKRKYSPGKANNWGSAKHCYSVEKCMDLINDNFVLLDSDVLLKKDISDLWDESCMYVGETVFQPYSKIQRILPYICFINTKMCKENKVHYFDDNYMHGLVKAPRSDNYDTGAGFYVHAHKFKHKDIKYNDYVVHFAAGSWFDIASKRRNRTTTDKDWANSFRYLWDENYNMGKTKKVIYTCITGGYDELEEPKALSTGFDHVCFTDNEHLLKEYKGSWQIRPIPEELKIYSKVKQQRGIKINAHKYLPEYDLSVWIDGVVDILKDINPFIEQECKNGHIFIPQHPNRKCIYKEMDAVIKIKKDTAENVEPLRKKYQLENYPKENGMVQSNIMVRYHNEEDCKAVMNEWWNVLSLYSHRDQLSFNYALWKHPTDKFIYLDKKTCEGEYFKWNKLGHIKIVKKKVNEVPKPIVSRPQTPSQTQIHKVIRPNRVVRRSMRNNEAIKQLANFLNR